MMHTLLCGQNAARTHVVISYHGPDGIEYATFDTCCRWVDTPEMTALIDEADVIEISYADGFEYTRVTDDASYQVVNPYPGHTIAPGEPWSWTRIKGLPVIVDETGPDEPLGQLEVRPRPGDIS